MQDKILRQTSQTLEQVAKQMFRTILSEQSMVYNQCQSYDHFISSDLGIKSIIQDMFRVANPVLIEPTEVTVNGKKRIIKSIEIDVRFQNVSVQQKPVTEEEIELFLKMQQNRDSDQEEEKIQKMKYVISETQIPQEARLTGKSLKVDIYADIHIMLASYSEEHLQGEKVEERIEKMINQNVAQIPLMVGSKFCMLSGKTKQQLIKLQEDPLDLGGYFILKSNEWSIDFVESLKMNELQLRAEPKKRLIRGFIISKPGDAYQNSFQTDITYKYRDNNIVVQIKEYERLDAVEVPFYVIFKLFGVVNEVEMMEMIIQDDVNSQDPTSLQLQSYIQAACDSVYPHFEDAPNWHTTEQVLENLTAILNQDWVKRKVVDSVIVYTPQKVQDAYMGYMLPHMGSNALDSEVKMRYFGEQIRKILLAFRDNSFPDKHTYLEKRIHATGQNLSKKFKKTFNHQVIRQLRTSMNAELRRSRNIHSIDVVQMISTLLTNNINNKMMQKSIVSGQTSSSSKSNDQTAKNRIQSQKINRKNIVCSVATMRMITNSKLSRDKQSKKIIEQRSVQPSFAGYICPVQSSDNGEKAGKIKSLSSLSVITNSQSSDEVIDMMWQVASDQIYEINTFEARDVKRFGLRKVIVNGFWVAYIPSKNVYMTANLLRRYRRENPDVWKYLTVYVTPQLDLYLYSDFGRVLNPLIIVHYNREQTIGKDGRKSEVLAPYTNLTPQNIEYILSGKATVDWLLENQIIEYISVEESHNCLVAETPTVYLHKMQPEQRQNAETQYNFTHILIPQSLIGIVALLSPFGNHSQTKRITMFTNQAKQSCGWAMYNFPYRMDKGMIVQQYISSPLVRTVMNDFFPSNGQQLVVAYMIYDGFNQEDSIVFNKGSVDQGLLNAVYYTFEETQIKYNEYIDQITGIQPPNAHGNHLKLKNGIIQKGVWIEKFDVLVAKKEQSRGSAPAVTSLLYKGDEAAYVEDVIQFQDEQFTTTIRVKLKIVRNIKQGDKLASGQGCKSIVSRILPSGDMPFTEDGIIPDMIFNCHSLPTRLMIGQVLEAAYQRAAVELCDTFDATMFSDVSTDLCEKLYEEYGIKDYGNCDLYNGDTGERIKSRIFVAPNFYMRLQKFAVTAKYCVNQGPIDIVTRQAIHSRSRGGGSRLGEMELASLFSSGTPHTLKEKAYNCSDGCTLYFCRQCGQRAEFNKDTHYQMYNCSKCKDRRNIVALDSTWSLNLFISSLNSMGVDLQMNFDDPSIETTK